MLKRINFFVLLILTLIPFGISFAQTNNVGIIPSNIWYSKDPFEAGDKIKIYTVIYNSDSRELSGTVIFFDNKVFLGKSNFTVPGKSVRDVSIDWTATVGDHVIFAKIENAKFLETNGKYEEIYVAENTTEESKRRVSQKIEATNSKEDTIADSEIGKIISENTPTFVAKTIDSLEGVREQGSEYATLNIQEVKEKLDLIKKEKNTGNALTEEELEKSAEKGSNEILLDKAKNEDVKEKVVNKIEEPFQYLKLFFLNLMAFVFKSKVAFYIILALVVFLILRFIWRLIF